MNCTLHIDGGSRGNPGPGAAGVVLTDAQTKQVVFAAGYFLGAVTNNQAEYQGLLHGVKQAQAMNVKQLQVYADSELLVRQIQGKYRVKAEGLKPLYAQAMQDLQQLEKWSITHVYREKNEQADRLANQAMDAKADIVLVDQSASEA